MTQQAWVILLAALATCCALVTARAAWIELNRIRARSDMLIRANFPDDPVMRWRVTEPGGYNPVLAKAVADALADQWKIGRLAIVTVRVIAPAGILLGFASAVVAAA